LIRLNQLRIHKLAEEEKQFTILSSTNGYWVTFEIRHRKLQDSAQSDFYDSQPLLGIGVCSKL
jgi:hypothetical protein